ADAHMDFDDDDGWLEGGLQVQGDECSEYTADEFEGNEIPDSEWIVENMIPSDDVTLNMGDGGAGKTTIMLQLLVGKTVGRPWVGKGVGEPARTIFFSGEERRKIINRRLNDIINGASSPYRAKEPVKWLDLAGLKILGLSDRDALLALPDKSTGRI